MKYNLNQKKLFELKGSLTIEIKGFDSMNQRVKRGMNAEDQYIILLNGYRMLVSESFLDYMIKNFECNQEIEESE